MWCSHRNTVSSVFPGTIIRNGNDLQKQCTTERVGFQQDIGFLRFARDVCPICGDIRHSASGFTKARYPSPYCTQRETRLRVAEEMLVCSMTWL